MKKKPTVKKHEPIMRLEHWPRLLADFIESRRKAPFEWGTNDCCLFACDAVHAITGLDPAAKTFRGKYKTAVGAGKILKKHGGVEGVAENVCEKHGFGEITIPFAMRGDVVSCDMTEVGEAALGICLGAQSAFIGITDGMRFIPTINCRRAWRIG